MKGLLYKEFFLGRKNYLAFLALFFVSALLGVLVCLSMLCGNLQSVAVEEPETVQVFAGVFTYVPYALALLAVFCGNQSVYRDYASGFMKYSYTLPLKAVKAVGARYVTGLIVLAAGSLAGMVHAGIISLLTDTPFLGETLQNMAVILGIVVFLYAGGMPLALRFKESKAVSGAAALFGVAAYLVAGGLFFNGMQQFETLKGADAGNLYVKMVLEKYGEIRGILLPFFPVILPAILGISFLASVSICQRREK